MMIFNQIMALIMPSFVAAFFYYKMTKKKMTGYEKLSMFVLFMLITNTACYAILIYLQNTMVLLFSITFTMKYCILATVIALVVATLYRFVELNINFNMKVESTNEKND